jgi:hypothetical protein
MLEHTTNHDQIFDATLRRAIPFMIFAPQSFTAQLAAKLGGLWRYYASHDSVGDGEFLISVDYINKMLDTAIADILDPETVVIISDFTLQRSSFNNRLIRLEQEVRDIRRELANRKPRQPRIVAHTPTTVQTPASAPIPEFKIASTSTLMPTPMSEIRRGRPPKVCEYQEELNKLNAFLKKSGMKPRTIDQYIATARGILEKYGGVTPTDEQFRADALSGHSAKLVSNHVSVLRRLREVMGNGAVGPAIEPAAQPIEPGPIKVEPENVPVKISLINKGVDSASTAIQNAITSIDAGKVDIGSDTLGGLMNARIERMKRLASQYLDGDIITMEDAITLTGDIVDKRRGVTKATEEAMKITLRHFVRSGYAEKLRGTNTYRRTGKQWGGAENLPDMGQG